MRRISTLTVVACALATLIATGAYVTLVEARRHTNPPIILGKGSLVWDKDTKRLNPHSRTRIFAANGSCDKTKVLNFALIGLGTSSLTAWTTATAGGVPVTMEHPLEFQGSGGYKLTIRFNEYQNIYTLHKGNFSCRLYRKNINHGKFEKLPDEFRHLTENVTWNGKAVDLDRKIRFVTKKEATHGTAKAEVLKDG